MIKKSNKKPRFKKSEMHRDLPDVYRYGGKCITNKTGGVYGESVKRKTSTYISTMIWGAVIELQRVSSGIDN